MMKEVTLKGKCHLSDKTTIKSDWEKERTKRISKSSQKDLEQPTI